MKLEQPQMLRIEKIMDEAKDIRTFIFSQKLNAYPGQFVNVWIPGLDEKPFSVSYQDNGRFGITCFAVGPFSKKLNSMKTGEKVGIRGPYGNGFKIKRGHVALVGGGCGTAPLAFLANSLKKKGAKVEFITGARNSDYVMYEKRMKKAGIKIHIATDDGSKGHKGFSTELLEQILKKNPKISMVYTCGPEIMMKKIVDICSKYKKDCQVSMERYMKCGFGVCGQCCMDNSGLRVCKDGPVFNKKDISKLFEFNKYHRDAAGSKVPFNVCK